MFYSLPLSVKPLDDPNFDPGESIVMDADTGHLTTISNRSFAEDAVRAINDYAASTSREAALREALKAIVHGRDAEDFFIGSSGMVEIARAALKSPAA